MSNLVSAVITTHNRQDLLVRAVKSVLCQTYKNLELIVVDDASDERADELLNEFNLRYIYIPKEESKGGNHARNKGILASKGKYIAFLDDDDYWLPNKIEKQIELIDDKKCDFVYCGKTVERITADGKTDYYVILPNPSFYGDMHKKILLTICCCTTSTMMVSKKALHKIGLFDENIAFWQDYELTIRLAQITPFFFINEPLCVYRKDYLEHQRLTNKFFGWKRAVEHIQQKHHNLYNNLPFRDYKYTKILVWYDSILRCKTSGLRWRALYYKLLVAVFYRIPTKLGIIIHNQ